MKTTIQIPDNLPEEALKLAAKEKTRLKALVEEGLRLILDKRNRRSAFQLRKASFKGKGLQPHLAGASWEQIREKIYEGRGGISPLLDAPDTQSRLRSFINSRKISM
jgi:hypothetical protein